MWVEVVLLVLLLMLLKKALSKPDGLPPGRWGLPLLGYIPVFNRRTFKQQLQDLQKQHGDVYTWRLGTQVVIFIHDYKLTKETFTRPEVTDRPDWIFFNLGEKPPLGIQFEVTDPKMKEFQDMMTGFNFVTDRTYYHDLFTWLPKILPKALSNRIFKLDYIKLFVEKFFQYYQEVIEEHRDTLDRDNPRDVIDSYLMDMEEKQDDPDSMLCERDLAWIVLDLFFAGSQTTGDTLKFAFFYLACNPRAQKKLHAELDKTLGDALATLEHRSRLPYTEAVIHEVLRMSTLTPIGIHHMVNRDFQLAGYTIPKGSIINSVALSIHHDARYWKDPQQFLPERWLDDQGHFNSKKEGFLPFSVGKRQCVGEALARMELLILLTTVMANFTISPPLGKTVDLTPDPGSPTFHVARTQDVVFTMRKE